MNRRARSRHARRRRVTGKVVVVVVVTGRGVRSAAEIDRAENQGDRGGANHRSVDFAGDD
jgi:hypothetical protein